MLQPPAPELRIDGHHIIDELERGIERFRAHVAQQAWVNIAMKHLDDLIASQVKLRSERADLLQDRDAEKARADKAESDLADLRKQVVDDEAKALTALQEMEAEVEAEKPQSQAQAVTTTSTAPSGATVQTTVDPAAGQTTVVHSDPTTGAETTTVVQHDSGEAVTTDASGGAAVTNVEAVQVATDAAAAQGVVVPAT